MALTIDGSDPSGDLGDLLDAKFTTPGAWTSYTPVLSGSTWAVGNGTISGAYTQIGKTVHFTARFVLGSTSTKGSASPRHIWFC